MNVDLILLPLIWRGGDDVFLKRKNNTCPPLSHLDGIIETLSSKFLFIL